MHDRIEFPRFTQLIPAIVMFALLACLARYAEAAEPGEGVAAPAPRTLWACWYNRDLTVHCRLREAAAPAPALRAEEQRHFDNAPGTSLAAARRGELPAPVKVIREQPGALVAKTVVIPLHTEPFEMGFVAQLAQAVMCGANRADCEVRFGTAEEAGSPGAVELADATDAALND